MRATWDKTQKRERTNEEAVTAVGYITDRKEEKVVHLPAINLKTTVSD